MTRLSNLLLFFFFLLCLKSATGIEKKVGQPCPSSWPVSWFGNLPAGWKYYTGDTSVFHCGYRGILETHGGAEGKMINECFYDEKDALVGPGHPYAGCAGTPDEYDFAQGLFAKLGHALLDAGGPCNFGTNNCQLACISFLTSIRHAEDHKQKVSYAASAFKTFCEMMTGNMNLFGQQPNYKIYA